MTDAGAATAESRRLAALIDDAASREAADARRPLMVEGLLNFGAEFVKLAASRFGADPANYKSLHDDVLSICREWLQGDALSDRADEDARRARFALWFCSLTPAIARVAARIVYRLPEGHPDRDVDAATKLLVRQFQFAVERRIGVASALDAIAGLLQLQRVSDERAISLINAGKRILEREPSVAANDNFHILAVLTLHQLAGAAEERHEDDTAAWLRGERDRMAVLLEGIESPAPEGILLRSMLAKTGAADASALRSGILPRDGEVDDTALLAAQQEGRHRYRRGEYGAVIELLTPLLPGFEERYLTAMETSAVATTGGALSETLLCVAYSHARVREWDTALRLVDRGKSLRMRHEQVLRRRSGAVRALELQAMLSALDRGLDPALPLPDVDPVADPVGAKLSTRSQVIEAYRQHRASLLTGDLEGAGIAELADWLAPDQAALILADSGNGLLAAIVTRESSDVPLAASILPPAERRRLAQAFADGRSGWLVTVASPELVEDPSASLANLIAVMDEAIGIPVAAALRDSGVRRLIVVPHSFLHFAPYWALPSLAEFDVTTAPSAYHVMTSTTEPVPIGGRALVIGNPTLDLPTAEAEAVMIAEVLRHEGFAVDRLLGTEATEAAMNARVAGASLLHFAGHGRSNVMRPMQSALEVHPGARGQPVDGRDPLLALADGATFTPWKDNERWADILGTGRLYERSYPVTERTDLRLEYALRGTLLGQYAGLSNSSAAMIPLRVSELWSADDLITERRLVDCALAFLSACEVGQGELSVSLDEHAGLPAALELAGARALVCPLWRVNDVTSAVFAALFYEELLARAGEVDLGNLVSLVRRTMRTMPAGEASRRIRELASRSTRAATRFRLEAAARRVELEATAPFADPLSWAAFAALGASRLLVGDAPKNVQRNSAPPRSATDHAPVRIRPLFSEGDEAPVEVRAPDPGYIEEFVVMAKATHDDAIVTEALRLLSERAQRRLKRQETDAAREDFAVMLELEPDDARAHAGLGAVAIAKGDLRAADLALERALALDPELAVAHRDRGYLLMADMNLDGALSEYANGLRTAPNDYDLLFACGLAHMAAGDPFAALSDFVAASQARPEEVAPHLLRATLYLQLQQPPRALDACSQAIALRPEDGASYLQRAAVYAASNDVANALADCDTALLLLADQAPAYTQKAYFLALLESLDDCLDAISKALEINPAFVQAYYMRACAFSISERPGTIVDDLRRAIAAHPSFRTLGLVAPELQWARDNVPGVRELLSDGHQ